MYRNLINRYDQICMNHTDLKCMVNQSSRIFVNLTTGFVDPVPDTYKFIFASLLARKNLQLAISRSYSVLSGWLELAKVLDIKCPHISSVSHYT